MNTNFFDILIAKEYLTQQNGVPTQKTAWNKVGRAWLSKSRESLSFELYHQPNQRYVIQLKDKRQNQETASEESSI